jgi:hypothetical protein
VRLGIQVVETRFNSISNSLKTIDKKPPKTLEVFSRLSSTNLFDPLCVHFRDARRFWSFALGGSVVPEVFGTGSLLYKSAGGSSCFIKHLLDENFAGKRSQMFSLFGGGWTGLFAVAPK